MITAGHKGVAEAAAEGIRAILVQASCVPV